MEFEKQLTQLEVCQKAWELAQIEKRKQHKPISVTELLNRYADRAVVLHAAGNSRAISLNIFRTSATPAAANTAINALV